MSIEKLQTSEDKHELVNFTLNVKDLPKELRQYLKNHIYNKTYDYYSYACLNDNKYENSLIGFQVYRDYYKVIDLFYLGNDNYFHGVELGNLYSNNKIELIEWTNCRTIFSKAKEQIHEILKDKNLDIIHDYDYEQIMDAIACGDYDLVDDIVGDRDLAELI